MRFMYPPVRLRRLYSTGFAVVLLALSASCAPRAPGPDTFKKHANAICVNVAEQTAELGKPASDTDLPGYVDQLLAINETAAATMRRLVPPVELKAPVREMLAEISRANVALSDAAAAALRADRDGVAKALARYERAAKRFDSRAAAIGLVDCRGKERS